MAASLEIVARGRRSISRTAPDARVAWFENEPRALFITDQDGHLLAANIAAHRCLDERMLSLDPECRLRLPAGNRDRRLEVVGCHGASAVSRVIPLDAARWLGISIRRHADQLVVAVAEIDARMPLDLVGLARDLGLSACEARIFEPLIGAECPKAISRRLDLSIHTVRAHIRAIYAKLGARSVAELQRRVLQAYYLVH